MSAPQTNVEKQARRHRPAIAGIAVALAIAFFAALFFAGWDNPAPQDGDVIPPQSATGAD